MIVMALCGLPNGDRTPYDGQYLQAFDFEANDGTGEIRMTENISEAKKFTSIHEAVDYCMTTPKCRPLRSDGKPNRPLTATNWIFAHHADNEEA